MVRSQSVGPSTSLRGQQAGEISAGDAAKTPQVSVR